jgi:hypothetical protein
MAEMASQGLTFEKVWAMFQETGKRMEESDRRLREGMEESDRRLKESLKETARKIKEVAEQQKETSRIVGGLGNRFGELAEHLVAPNIKEKFNDLGFHFTRCSRDLVIADEKTKRSLAEVDILLENGDIVIAVEVKAKPDVKDIDEHVKRMETLRRADCHNDRRKYQGAVAGAIMIKEVKQYAPQAGFYVIEQSGDTVKIDIPRDFRPREW